MSPRYVLGRALQVMGMAAVLVGLAVSVSLGAQDEGLESMRWEFLALLGGGGLFVAGRLLQGRGPA